MFAYGECIYKNIIAITLAYYYTQDVIAFLGFYFSVTSYFIQTFGRDGNSKKRK